MNRLTTPVLGVGAALALSVRGLTTATASDHQEKVDYPVVGKLVKVDARSVLEAGTACRDEIKVHEKGAFRVIQLSKRKTLIKWKDWSHVTYRNTRTDKRIHVGEGGDGLLKDRGHGVTKARADEENIFAGKGINGIVYTRGDVRFTIFNIDTPDQEITITKVRGKYVELCSKLGSRPA